MRPARRSTGRGPTSSRSRPRSSTTIKAAYALNKTWSFTGGYAYEYYHYKDAQFDGYRNTVPSSSNQDSYLDGVYANPQYKANILYGTVTYRF